MQDIDWKNKNPRSDLILTENLWVVTRQFLKILCRKENKHSEFFNTFICISGNLIKNTKILLYYKSLQRPKRKKNVYITPLALSLAQNIILLAVRHNLIIHIAIWKYSHHQKGSSFQHAWPDCEGG